MSMKLIKLDSIDITLDPVRPELSLDYRKDLGREMYGLSYFRSYGNVLGAIVCISYCSGVPKTVSEMTEFTNPNGHIAVAYTLFNTGKVKGSGKNLIEVLHQHMKDNSDITRLVTLSPKTDMAKNFHLSMGAKLINENTESYNFEYDLF